jgi:hypothetical protein
VARIDVFRLEAGAEGRAEVRKEANATPVTPNLRTCSESVRWKPEPLATMTAFFQT